MKKKQKTNAIFSPDYINSNKYEERRVRRKFFPLLYSHNPKGGN